MQKQEHVAYIKDNHRVSHAWACRIMQVSRKSQYDDRKMPEKDARLKSIIETVIGSSRMGRQKVIRRVQRKHPKISSSKIRRVYEREGFSLYKRLKRRVKQQIANPISIPLSANQEWAIDFMSDTLENGRKFRTLNVIDHFDRSCKGIFASHSLPANKVVALLERVIEAHGKPKCIRTDNGPEFRSKKFQLWMKNKGIDWSPIQNGKPQQNAIVERFNRTFREDILDANLFLSIDNAQHLTDNWIKEYNEERPHQALGYKTPLEYAA